MIELKDYQQRAVENLKVSIENTLKSSESGNVIFQAPTGSGKTVVVSALLKKLVKDRQDERKFSFIWISVRMLHEQSKEKLEKYYEDDRLLQCSYFEDLQEKRIDENEILFINWHSINKKDINIYVKENEQDNNLNCIIENTKAEGREIILIIDESHHTANSEKSKELIDIIGPKVTLEVSATPHLKEKISGWVSIPISDVKNEQMIKSEIAVNPEFLGLTVGSASSDELVIQQAFKKREELLKLYKNEDSEISPLILIQLPDSKGELVSKKEEIIKILEDKFKVTEASGRLAVWLSEEKTETLINIEKNDNEVECLVFKQAPALGWDCPRASILVIFRESKSFTFTIQTIGRIMRMPELKYYSESELNKGFVFTNLPNIEITEDYAKDYITVYEAKRDASLYNNLNLPSVYLKRQRERTRLSGEFAVIFMRVAEESDLINKITTEIDKITLPIIADGKIVDVDKSGRIEYKGQIDIQLNEIELNQVWEKFISDNCTPFAPADSSDRMKTAIYQFFKEKYNLEKYDSNVQKIVIAKENRQKFIDFVNLAKDIYKQEVVDKVNVSREIITISDWEVPLLTNYNSRYKKEELSKSIMKPFYTSKPSEPEVKFIEMINNSNKVKWWFKNGETEIKYFAVLRTDGLSFYPDFIIQFSDNNIGIFDSKGGMTAKDAKERAEGLQKYIKEQNTKGMKLWGGIAIFVHGSWRYNDNDIYIYDENNLTNWKVLEI